jgi:hypothetical protein
MAGAMDWVLAMQQELAAEKKNNDEKKRAHRHYPDAVLLLSKLYAMAAASEAAHPINSVFTSLMPEKIQELKQGGKFCHPVAKHGSRAGIELQGSGCSGSRYTSSRGY